MIDIKKLELNGETLKNLLERRGYILDLEFLITQRKAIVELGLKIEVINKQRKTNRDPQVGRGLNEEWVKLNQEKERLEKDLDVVVNMIPNIPALTAPVGKDENDNKEIKVYKPTQKQKDEALFKDWIITDPELDTETGAKLAGARFAVLKGNAARIQRKMIDEALDLYTAMGYQEHYVPLLVNEDIMFGTGQYPKFKDDLFKVDKQYLIPTGEVPLTNMYRDEIINFNDEKVIKLCTHTPCFRKEVGSAGRDTKGIIRQHQFEKVELVKICHPQVAENELYGMIQDIENFVQKLGMQYRVIELCTGDMGFSGHKAFDIEIYFPVDNRYREIASITWCWDFQARRMNTRFKENGKTYLVNTINGTGLAAGRILEALKQYQM